LNEHINQCLCRDDCATFIGLFDLPRPTKHDQWTQLTRSVLYQFRQQMTPTLDSEAAF
jgi:hypothetical protein